MSDSQRATAQELAKVAIFPQLFRPRRQFSDSRGGIVQFQTFDVSRPHTGFYFLHQERLTVLLW